MTHVLVVGAHTDVVAWLWRSRVTTSTICTGAAVRANDPLDQHHTAIVLDAGATFEDRWNAARTLHAVTPIDRVVSFDDTEMSAAARIADRLGVPGGNPVEVVGRVHDKGALRRWLRAAGFPQPEHRPVYAAADILAFGERHGWPVVVKPTDSSGSQGIRLDVRADSCADALAQARAASPGDSVIVEERVSGVVLTIDTFTHEGEHHVVMIGVELFSTDTTHPLVMCTAMPAPLSPGHWEATARAVCAALTALEVRTGPAHTEAFLDPESGAVVIIEMQLRLGGEFPEVTRATLDVDTYELWSDQLRGEDISARLRTIEDTWRDHHTPSSIVYAGAHLAGDVRGLDTGEHRGVSIERNPNSPSRTRVMASYSDHYLAAIASASTVPAAIRTARRAVDAVSMRIATDPVIVGPGVNARHERDEVAE